MGRRGGGQGQGSGDLGALRKGVWAEYGQRTGMRSIAQHSRPLRTGCGVWRADTTLDRVLGL